MNGFMKFCFGLVALLAIAIAVTLQFAHKLENQNLAIVQSMSGDVEVRKTAGWWVQISPTITEYPKAGIYICSQDSKEHDPFVISFNNKSTATMNAQLGFRIDSATDEKIIALHQAAEGDDEKIWQLVVGTVNTEAQKVSTTFDPSDVMGGDKFPEFVVALQKVIIHNKELLESGIDIDKFNVIGKPIPDKRTEQQFDLQREADLAKRLAASKVKQLEAETEQERAEANRKTEHEKIEAQALMAKEKLDYERQKQNEVIAAQKKLELAQIAKQEAEVKAQQEAEVAKVEANKLREVAEIEKATEAARLEKEKLIAEQVKVAALAKKEQIDKSGAITEKEKLQLEIDMRTKIGVAEAYGKALASAKLPQMMVVGGNGDSKSANTNPFDILLQTMTLEKLNAVNAAPVK